MFIVRIITHQVSCPNLISRPKTRATNGTCHHTWSPASLYSGQWCFVSRSRSNASHQTIWTRASNWTSKVSTISQPVHVSQPSHHLICSSNLAHFMELFHPFNHLDYKMQQTGHPLWQETDSFLIHRWLTYSADCEFTTNVCSYGENQPLTAL